MANLWEIHYSNLDDYGWNCETTWISSTLRYQHMNWVKKFSVYLLLQHFALIVIRNHLEYFSTKADHTASQQHHVVSIFWCMFLCFFVKRRKSPRSTARPPTNTPAVVMWAFWSLPAPAASADGSQQECCRAPRDPSEFREHSIFRRCRSMASCKGIWDRPVCVCSRGSGPGLCYYMNPKSFLMLKH